MMLPSRPFKVMAYREATKTSGYRGWLASEKKDGWHVLIDKTKMVTKRQKKKFDPPFDLSLEIPLAAELVVLEEQSPAVASLLDSNSPKWKRARLYAFDTIGKGPFRERTKRVKKEVRRFCKAKTNCPLVYLHQQLVKNDKHLESLLKKITKRGGEGIVLTKPDSMYVFGRSKDRVKIKPFHDAEGILMRKKLHTNGNLKSVLLQPHGRHRFAPFFLGTGFSKNQRQNHSNLKVGSVIKFSYRELTRGKKPKEARFLHIRKDLN